MDKDTYKQGCQKHHRLSLVIGMPIIAFLSIGWFALIYQDHIKETQYIFIALGVTALFSWWLLFYKLPRNLGLYCQNCKCILSMGRNEAYAHDYGSCPKCGKELWDSNS